jgi:hypothetical protein
MMDVRCRNLLSENVPYNRVAPIEAFDASTVTEQRSESACMSALSFGTLASQRDALWRDVRQQNIRLQQLIEAITQLVARSRDVLRRQRPENSAPAGSGKNEIGDRPERPRERERQRDDVGTVRADVGQRPFPYRPQ